MVPVTVVHGASPLMVHGFHRGFELAPQRSHSDHGGCHIRHARPTGGRPQCDVRRALRSRRPHRGVPRPSPGEPGTVRGPRGSGGFPGRVPDGVTSGANVPFRSGMRRPATRRGLRRAMRASHESMASLNRSAAMDVVAVMAPVVPRIFTRHPPALGAGASDLAGQTSPPRVVLPSSSPDEAKSSGRGPSLQIAARSSRRLAKRPRR